MTRSRFALSLVALAGGLAVIVAGVWFIADRPLFTEAEVRALQLVGTPDPRWPAGSKIVGGVACFQEQRDGVWVPVSVFSKSGAVPKVGQTATGDWYFPASAGQIRVLIGCGVP